MSSLRRPLLTNHNRCWIWGRNVVLETLRANRWPVMECEPSARDEAVAIAADRGLNVVSVRDSEITKNCRSEDHQGLAARMPPFPYWDVTTLLKALPPNPALVLLDRIQDSHNFGAIVRSAEVLGIDGVIVGIHEQASVNSQVARSSAGAVNYVPIAESNDLEATVRDLRNCGFQIVGASDHAEQPIFETDFRQATLVLIGNEGRGIQPILQALCTQFVQIPMLGRVNSLNAAVSAGILFYEILRQRRQ